jgi:hypothetical protein
MHFRAPFIAVSYRDEWENLTVGDPLINDEPVDEWGTEYLG